jgi:hypothetical protein
VSGNVSIYGSGRGRLTPSGLRPGSHRTEKRREEKRGQQNVRLNISSASDLWGRQRADDGTSDTTKNKTSKNEPSFKIGDKVRHHTFGEGQVLAVKPTGDDQEVTVMFKKAGTKRLLASAARLESIE